MPHRSASLAIDGPVNLNIPVFFAPGKLIAEETQRRWQAAVVAGIIAMVHVDESLAARSQKPRKLAKHLDPAGGREYVTKYVPEAENHIEACLNLVKLFGAHCEEFSVSTAPAPHPLRRFQKHDFRDAALLGDASCARSIAGAHIEQCAAVWRDRGGYKTLDCIQVLPSLVRERCIDRRNSIVSRDGVMPDCQ